MRPDICAQSSPTTIATNSCGSGRVHICLDLLPADPVMSQESFIGSCELFGVREVIHGRAHPVRSMFRRNAAQLPQCILQPFAQALERLRVADAACLPVGIRQDK